MPPAEPMRYTVKTDRTLLEVLERMNPDASRRTLRRMLTVGRVTVDGRTERAAKLPVAAGAIVEIAPADKPAPGPDLDIVHEDERLMVVVKPSGLLTVPTRGPPRGGRDPTGPDTMVDRVKAHLRATAKTQGPPRTKGATRPDAFVVHRLDRDTSGVLLFAKDAATQERLQTAFAAGEVERLYLTVVEGCPDPPEGTFVSWLKQSATLQVYSTPEKRGAKKAVSHYKVLERGEVLSLVEVRLGTGRRAQIRVQMKDAGHPIAGDQEHGAVTDPFRRLALHATTLRFRHPWTGEEVVANKAPPSAWKKMVRRLKPEAEEGAEPSTGPADAEASAEEPEAGTSGPASDTADQSSG